MISRAGLYCTENLVPHRESIPRSVQLVASRYTDYVTPAHETKKKYSSGRYGYCSGRVVALRSGNDTARTTLLSASSNPTARTRSGAIPPGIKFNKLGVQWAPTLKNWQKPPV